MANEEHLSILKQGVEVWNEWREKCLHVIPDLCCVNLRETDLKKANLNRANLQEADLCGADLYKAELIGTNLSEANLSGARLFRANLERANLRRANLAEANLSKAGLIKANLNQAIITGVFLYGSRYDDWKINAIQCNFVYWDNKPYYLSQGKKVQERKWEQEHRFPKDRDFYPGEFEKRYKQLPTFEYYFEQRFTAIDAVLMDLTVQMISQKHPEFELRLDSLHSRGQPHAVFTVLQKEYVKTALKQITMFYEEKLIRLEGKREQLWEDYMFLANHPQINIQELIMGNQTKKSAGRDFHEHGAGSHKAAATSPQGEKEQQILLPESNQEE